MDSLLQETGKERETERVREGERERGRREERILHSLFLIVGFSVKIDINELTKFLINLLYCIDPLHFFLTNLMRREWWRGKEQ